MTGDNCSRDPLFPILGVLIRYDGKGDRASAASWRPRIIPGSEPAIRTWIGEAFFTAPKP